MCSGQPVHQCRTGLMIDRDHAAKVHPCPLPGGGAAFAVLTDRRQIRQAKVQRAALKKVQLPFDRVGGKAPRQTLHDVIRFFQEHVGDFGKAVRANFIPQVCNPFPVDHGTQAPVTQGRLSRSRLNKSWARLGGNARNFSLHPVLRPRSKTGPVATRDTDVLASQRIKEPLMPVPETPRHVLVVDDSRAQRHMLSMQLRRWGYQVTESEDAAAALRVCAGADVDIIISDWMMPGMTGLEFCRKFRALGRERYGYFVLLTSKSEKTEVADGLEAGADDFLTKPVSSGELRARLRAGERMLSMQSELLAKNTVIARTLDELQALYDSLDRDLIEARKLQQTLIRDRNRDYGWARVALMLRNSGRVGGDLVGSFQVDANRAVAYSIDVSGHGVASAMMTARLAGFLTGSTPDQNLAFGKMADGSQALLPPDQVAERFNRLMLEEIQAEQYFTMAFASFDRVSGMLGLVQAGHPHPVLIRRNGDQINLGNGGLPIGLIPEATYECIEVKVEPGDRLVLVSDGLTECPMPDGSDFGNEGLFTSLARSSGLSGAEVLEALVWDLARSSQLDSFPDDVSGVVVDLLGQEAGQHAPVAGIAQQGKRLFDW